MQFIDTPTVLQVIVTSNVSELVTEISTCSQERAAQFHSGNFLLKPSISYTFGEKILLLHFPSYWHLKPQCCNCLFDELLLCSVSPLKKWLWSPAMSLNPL